LLVGDKHVKQRFTNTHFVDHVTVTCKLNDRWLSEEIDNKVKPMLVTIEKAQNLPNEGFLSQKCKKMYCKLSVHDQVVTTQEVEQAPSVAFHHQTVMYIKDQAESYRKFFETRPIPIELHDRDPQDENQLTVYYAKAEVWAGDVIKGVEKNFSFMTPLTHAKMTRQPPVVEAVVENKKSGKADKKKDEKKEEKKPEEVVPAPPPEPQVQQPKGYRKEDIPKGNYALACSCLSFSIRLSTPFHKPAPDTLKLAIVFLMKYVTKFASCNLLTNCVAETILSLQKMYTTF